MGFFSNFSVQDAVSIANLFVKPAAPSPIVPPAAVSGTPAAAGSGTAPAGSSNMMVIIVSGIAAVVLGLLTWMFTRKKSRR